MLLFGLPACLPPACLPACPLPACLPACLLACLLARSLAAAGGRRQAAGSRQQAAGSKQQAAGGRSLSETISVSEDVAVLNNCGFFGDIIACDDTNSLHLTSNGGGSIDYVLQSKMKLFPLDVFTMDILWVTSFCYLI